MCGHRTVMSLQFQRHGGIAHHWHVVMDSCVLFRKDRSARSGGGVGLYVKEHQALPRDRQGVESLWVKIKGQAKMGDTVVGVYYRPLDLYKEVDEAFYGQLDVALRSQALVLL